MEIPQFIWWIVGAAIVFGMLLLLGLVTFSFLLLKASAKAFEERRAGLGWATNSKGKLVKLEPPKTGT